MKWLLLVGYYVPPRKGIGSVRTGQLIRYLPRNGWNVFALTPQLDDVSFSGASDVRTAPVVDFKVAAKRLIGVEAARGGHELLGVAEARSDERRGIRQWAAYAGYGVTDYANRKFGWLRAGTRAVRDLLRERHFDAVLSTGPPESVHVAAAAAAGRVPWIADFRDPWIGSSASALATFVDAWIEPLVIKKSSAITTVSEPIADRLRARYPHIPVFSIPNAFDAADWTNVPFARNDRCTIVYPGQFHVGKRDPSILLDAIRRLLASGAIIESDLSVEFYASPARWLGELINSFGLRRVVHVREEVSRAEILAIERSANALLLILWNDASHDGHYTGKLFEYLGARRPIITIGGPDRCVVDDVLRRVGCAERSRDSESLAPIILRLIQQHRRGSDLRLDESAVAPYECGRLVERFAHVLDECSALHKAADQFPLGERNNRR